MENLKQHWDKVYSGIGSKHTWTQHTPETILYLIESLNLKKDAAIIDVGGGDSELADHLLRLGFTNITVLDISANAIETSRQRLGARAEDIQWIVSDITSFKPQVKFDVWIDRAAFHFLREKQPIEHYTHLTKNHVSENGYLLIATFSDTGPDKCSGLEVKRYSKKDLTKLFEENYNRERCVVEDHITPAGVIQNFIYCLFKRRIGGGVFHNQCDDEYRVYEGNKSDTTVNACNLSEKGSPCCG